MDDPRDDGREPEQLAGGDGPRTNWTAVAVVVVLIAGAVLLATAAHHDARPVASRHKHTALPAPAPPSPVAPTVSIGSVFLDGLLRCTRTDHRHTLSVAMGVTNLGQRSLVLLGAVGVTSDAVLVRPRGVRIGTQGCGQAPADRPVRLGPGGDAVVTLAFRVGVACPLHALVSARVSFDGGRAGVVHADSSPLADLDQLNFAQCV
jgi:hypothetical protein